MKTKLPSFADNAGVDSQLMFCASRARASPGRLSVRAALMRCIRGGYDTLQASLKCILAHVRCVSVRVCEPGSVHDVCLHAWTCLCTFQHRWKQLNPNLKPAEEVGSDN